MTEVIEIEFASLEEARAMGPALLVERCAFEGLRLLEAPSYCEREGLGVLSVAIARPTNSTTAAPVADQPETDQ